MGLALRILPILAQDDPATAPGPSSSLPPQAQAVYLVLAVTLLLFLLLFVVIGVNVARRIARRREALRRLHEPQHRSAHAESAWAAAGRRVRPITEPLGPDLGRTELGLDDTDLGRDDTPWDDETDLGETDLDDDDDRAPPPAPA